MSVLPLFTVMLPGMCIVVMAQVQPKAVQVVLLSLTFAVPVLGDTHGVLCRQSGARAEAVPCGEPEQDDFRRDCRVW